MERQTAAGTEQPLQTLVGVWHWKIAEMLQEQTRDSHCLLQPSNGPRDCMGTECSQEGLQPSKDIAKARFSIE